MKGRPLLRPVVQLLTSSVKISGEVFGLSRKSLVSVFVIKYILWAAVTCIFPLGEKNRCLTHKSPA